MIIVVPHGAGSESLPRSGQSPKWDFSKLVFLRTFIYIYISLSILYIYMLYIYIYKMYRERFS